MKKKNIIFIFIILILFLIGCSKNKIEPEVDIFNIQIAKEKGEEYIKGIMNSDINGLKEISTPELSSSYKKEKENANIIGYKLGDIVETGNSVYIEFFCVRTTEKESRVDLDKYTVKVVKYNDDYKIAKVNGENLKEVFNNKNELSIITEGLGSSDLILTLEDIPLQMYPKDQKAMINKSQIPKKKFDRLGINYKGNQIAISTTDEKDSFIGLAVIEESSLTMNNLGNRITDNSTRGVSSNSITKSFVAYDILKDCKIKNMIFSGEEGELIVQYTKGNSKNLGLKIYKNPSGELIKIDFESIFPIDKYNIVYEGGDKSKIVINVVTSNKNKDISQELLGRYYIDLVEEKIDKM